MILKASQRGGAKQLGLHLLKAENEQVELHEVRGFLSETVLGAMKEAQAIARGTRCKQFLFSVSLNPPESESVPVDAFESALDRIEERTGLTGQPRIVIFHEKEGRRHAHAVWSRIDSETMTARPLPFFKTRLRQVSKELYLEHGWQMPRGLMDARQRDPSNFSLAEWQQAKRTGQDAKQLKKLVQECWAVADTKAAFQQALEERGLYLARGDRRAHVAITYEGEVLSIPRLLGRKSKEVSEKLGKADELRSVEETRQHIAETIRPRLQLFLREADQLRGRELAPLEGRRATMRIAQRDERKELDRRHELRWAEETSGRSSRLRKGIIGLWDRLTGRRAETVRQNEKETIVCLRRDRDERDTLVAAQLKDRRELQAEIRAVRSHHAETVLELHRDLARQNEAGNSREADGADLPSAFASAAEGGASVNFPAPSRVLRGRTSGREGQERGGPDLAL